MCALMVSRGRHANPVLAYTTALRRFYFGATAENDNFMAKMEKCCFLFAKNDYLIGITSIFSLK
mgnify:FL=1